MKERTCLCIINYIKNRMKRNWKNWEKKDNKEKNNIMNNIVVKMHKRPKKRRKGKKNNQRKNFSRKNNRKKLLRHLKLIKIAIDVSKWHSVNLMFQNLPINLPQIGRQLEIIKIKLQWFNHLIKSKINLFKKLILNQRLKLNQQIQ